MTSPETGGATIFGDYRYRLWRTWAGTERLVCWIMLNPSTADGTEDDPTIRKCRGFSQKWGRSGLVVVNLFAVRSTDPKGIERHDDPIGPLNDDAIRSAVRECDLVVCAWGAHRLRSKPQRIEQVLALLKVEGVQARCLGTSRDGSPRHPLMLGYATELEALGGPP